MMQSQLMEVLQKYWSQLLIILPKLVLAVVIFVVAWFIARRFKNIVAKKAVERLEDPLLAKFISRITKWIVVIIGLIISLHIVGLSKIASSILAGAGVSAIVFGFAFKDIGENLLAGIMLAFKRPFKVGDIIETEKTKGVIKELDIRSTHIRSFDGMDIYIPNALIVKNPLINYTRDGILRYDFVVGIDFADDVNRARQLILDNIIQTDGVLNKPAPFIIIKDLGKSSVNLQVFYWINSLKYKGSIAELNTNILNQTKNILLQNDFFLPADIVELKIHKEEHPFPVKLLKVE